MEMEREFCLSWLMFTSSEIYIVAGTHQQKLSQWILQCCTFLWPLGSYQAFPLPSKEHNLKAYSQQLALVSLVLKSSSSQLPTELTQHLEMPGTMAFCDPTSFPIPRLFPLTQISSIY